jgi:ACS family tartrate transporter-like MFS transporter
MNDALGRRTMRKVIWRLVPYLGLLYTFNIIDRANVGFARLGMVKDVGFSDDVIDWGYGIFYVGYLLFEVPSNMLLRRFGARRWIARIMISWGLVSTLTAWVVGPVSYFGARILWGVAEAGFFPGIIYYLTAWFPAVLRARVVAWFMLAIPVATMLGNIASGLILDSMQGVAGLAGWQWLFILEGIPSVVLGASVLLLLPDGPRDAAWLSADERAWLEAERAREDTRRIEAGGADTLAALADARVWILIGLYLSVAIGTNATGAYLPKLVKDSFEPLLVGATGDASGLYWKIGLISTLPQVAAVVAMLVVSRISDASGRRSGVVAVSLAVAAVGWLLAAAPSSPWVGLAGLCLAQAGMMAVLPVFWALPPLFLGGVAAAAGIALVNSVANAGGIFAPKLVGVFGAGPMAAIMVWGMLMAVAAWWAIERRTALGTALAPAPDGLGPGPVSPSRERR